MTAPIPPPVPSLAESLPLDSLYPQSETKGSRRSQGPNWIVAGLIGLVVGVGGTFAIQTIIATSGGNQALADAIEACALEDTAGIALQDEGKTIVFDSKGDDDLIGADYLDVYCLFEELDMPSSISTHVAQTTSMDGRQSEIWDGIEVSWSYHPKRGLDGLLTFAD